MNRIKRVFKYIIAITRLMWCRIFKRKNKGIAFIVNSFEKGGVEQVVQNLYKGFRAEGYNSYVISLSNNIGILANGLKYPNHLRIVYWDAIDLINYCAKNNIRTLHYHYSTFKMPLMRVLGFKIYYTLHNTYLWYKPKDWRNLKILLKFCNGIIAVSDWTKEYFTKKTGINKVTTIINGIDIQKIINSNQCSITREKLQINERDKVFVNVASITEGKYQMCLIGVMEEIIKKRQDIKILLVGNILDKEYSKEFMRQLNKSKAKEYVKFLEYIQQEELGAFLKSVPDIFILPSIHEAGVTLSVIESLLCGVPVIMSDFNIKKTFPVSEDIIPISLPYEDIIDITPEKARKLSREVKSTNQNEIVEKIIYAADNAKELRAKVDTNKYHMFSIENMVKQHIDMIYHKK